MARYELTGPDGSRYEVSAPDGTSEREVMNVFAGRAGGQQDEFAGFDFNKPIEELRPIIANLPEKSRDRALTRWAQGVVSKERETMAGWRLPNAGYGLPLVGGLLDEWTALISDVGHRVTGNGHQYSEALALERERERQAGDAMPIVSGATKLAAGLVGGAQSGMSRLFASPTTVGQVARGVGVGVPLGAVEGFTRGEGGFDNRTKSAEDTATFSGAIGVAIPIVGAGAQRAYGGYQDYIRPGITAARSGPGPAADEILANRIYREGSSPQAKRLELQRGQNNARLYSNSTAELPETIADTSDAMQRLTGSAYRSGGEAGNLIRGSLHGRQRGADNSYTRRAPQPDTNQQGQRGRLFDTVRRALLVRSQDGARATERQIINEQRTEGRQLYEAAYQNDDPFDLSGPLTAMGLQINEHTGAHRATLQRALDLFVNRAVPGQPAAHTIRRFDAAKKQLDDMIDASGRAGNNNLRRQLTEFKDGLLGAVHENGANPTYAQARAAWGSHAERRDALELGRNALRDDSDVTLEAFNDLSPGNQVLFRVGLVDGMRRLMSTKRPGDDLTRVFQQFRVQELMNGIIPRSQLGNAVFANRAERFGDVLNREARMVQTRNNVLGNSATAQRQQDDAQFTGEALRGMWDRFRQAPGILNMAVEGVGYGLQRIFGYRQDVALELARRLMETDRTAQNQILRRLVARGGPDRFTEFARLVDESSRALQTSVPAALGQGGSVKIGDGRR